MAEILTLTAPLTKPSTNVIHIQQLTINVDAGSIYVQWLGDDGQTFSASYPTPAPAGSSQPTGAALITTLNSANLSTTSLVKRVLQRLQADGYIAAGTISGNAS